jgi:hypothetical protein
LNKIQLEKQLTLLHKDLSKCDQRCKKISKACGLEDNHLFLYAMKQTEDVLAYIQELREKGNDQ